MMQFIFLTDNRVSFLDSSIKDQNFGDRPFFCSGLYIKLQDSEDAAYSKAATRLTPWCQLWKVGKTWRLGPGQRRHDHMKYYVIILNDENLFRGYSHLGDSKFERIFRGEAGQGIEEYRAGEYGIKLSVVSIPKVWNVQK